MKNVLGSTARNFKISEENIPNVLIDVDLKL